FAICWLLFFQCPRHQGARAAISPGAIIAASVPGESPPPQDMLAGTFRPPWEDQVKVTDGTSCGFPAPTRMFGAKTGKAAE
ncbi:MAG TPA: hypothetical protein VEU95_02570, partial [Micropepsaceae bacterium]|nr:hypothetical protein [Micropepsaceae bacterium]